MATPPAAIISLAGWPDLNGRFTTNFDPESTTPGPFSFDPVTNAIAGNDYEASATINGIPAVSAPISISGGQYKINDDSYTSLPGTISNGDEVTVKLTASSEPSQTVSLSLTIGDVTEDFTVMTASEATLIGALEIVGTSVPSNEGYGLYGFGVTSDTLATLTVMEENGYKFLRAHYKAGNVGNNSVYGGCGLDQINGDREVFVAYWARMPNIKHGLKNIKLFGVLNEEVPSNYANATFSLDYTGVDMGCMFAVQFGDGTTIENDSNNILKFDGTNPEYVGRSYPGASISTPQNANFGSDMWGTDWHLIKLMFRHNTGDSAENEVANGATKVIIDGLVYADADGLFTRHWSNKMFRGVGMFGITQENPGFDFDFDICEGMTVSNGDFIEPLVTPI